MGSLFAVLAQAINLLTVLLIVRIVMSWISPMGAYSSHPAMRLLYNITEPIMAPFRSIIPPIGGLDLSPMLLFIVLNLIQGFFARLALSF